jgi:hypothetical protein
MGYACVFDIFLRLEPTPANQEAYRAFMDEIMRRFDHEYSAYARSSHQKILLVPTADSAACNRKSVDFVVGEYPYLPHYPRHCNYFPRFWSKVSGTVTQHAEPCIREVYAIAKRHFGDRVHFWNGRADDPGIYGDRQVSNAEKALMGLETETGWFSED